MRRGLKATGSAVFVLQPNSERVGRMRPWLWEFMAWTAREWNQVQDAWWWNTSTMPTGGATEFGLMRGSLKACVWLGSETCYRNQDAVLWGESEANAMLRLSARAGRQPLGQQHRPSGHRADASRMSEASERRGGVTPFNVLPMANTNSSNSAGAKGHGAGTPCDLVKWWTTYITPDGGTVVDPFCGSGTMLAVAREQGLRAIGIEKEERYCEIAASRLKQRVLFHAG